jgi:hypothetical protein
VEELSLAKGMDYPFDWIITFSIILFPLGLFVGLFLRHQRRLKQFQRKS